METTSSGARLGDPGLDSNPSDAAGMSHVSVAGDAQTAHIVERIAAAALRTTDGRVFSEAPPARHCHVIEKMRAAGCEDHDIFTATQGFTTTLGRFLHRRAAFRVAEAAKQFVRDPTARTHGLFSEDVW